MRRLSLVVLVGCGYPPLDGGDANTGSCDPPGSYPATLYTQQAEYSSSDNVLVYDGNLNQATNPDRLRIELVGGSNTFPHEPEPATVPLSGSELNGGTCDACVLVATQCAGCTLDTGEPKGWYMATGGTIAITEADSNGLSGTLSGVAFTHVTRSDNDGTTAPVNDGCTTKIDSISFSSSVSVVN